jgi:hypothetical protein
MVCCARRQASRSSRHVAVTRGCRIGGHIRQPRLAATSTSPSNVDDEVHMIALRGVLNETKAGSIPTAAIVETFAVC